ncbi:MAG: hypothetical protein Q4G68_04400 [Planctomycetia bacterium]|nr:hypothetical protein [Planctomycetia bacterium]
MTQGVYSLRVIHLCALFCLFWFPGTTVLFAADSVLIVTPQGEETTLQGEIESLTGSQGLLLKEAGHTASTVIPFHRVLRIDTERTAAHVAGDVAFAQGEQSGELSQYATAITNYAQARQTDEVRTWVRVWLTWRLLLCYERLGRVDEAVGEFFLLCRIDPYTPFWENVPLLWTKRALSTAGTDTITAQARLWLSRQKNPAERETPAARLLAASYLLDAPDPALRRQALDALTQLAVLTPSQDATESMQNIVSGISRLAMAQLVRTRIARDTNPADLDRLEKLIELLPPAATPGLRLTLATGRMNLNEVEKAREQYQRVSVSPWAAPELRAAANALLTNRNSK